jgi:hypothetical protein
MSVMLLRNAGIGAIAFLVAYAALRWEVLLLIGLILAAIALEALAQVAGIRHKALLPIIGATLLIGAAFTIVDPGVWRWVFVAVGVFLGLAMFSRNSMRF